MTTAVLPGGPVAHVDADCFFASVEIRDDPSLAGQPVAVADQVVACASYEARAWGVHAGSTVRDAQLQCPSLVVVKPRGRVYEEASEDLFAVFASFAPRVEPGSMEEGFLDVRSHPWEAAPVLAQEIRREVRRRTGLPVSVGIGRTKLMAKTASRAAKPDGWRVIDPETEVHTRPQMLVGDLWGVGPTTRERVEGAGMRTVADLRAAGPDRLVKVAGTLMGRLLHEIATGTDSAEVRLPPPKRSFSSQRSTAPYAGVPRTTEEVMTGMATDLAHRLGKARARAVTLEVAAPRSDGEVVRRTVLSPPTADAAVLLREAVALAVHDDGSPWRTSDHPWLRIGLLELLADDAPEQLTLL